MIRDLRKVPIETLKVQEIRGRLALLQDANQNLAKEMKENAKIICALMTELEVRKTA